jgi:hypothetical protein
MGYAVYGLLSWYWDPVEVRLKEFQMERDRLDQTVWPSYKWYLRQQLGLDIAYGDEKEIEAQLLQGQPWPVAVARFVQGLYDAQREVWLYFARKASVVVSETATPESANVQIVQYILTKYPTFPPKRMDLFEEFWDGLYWEQYQASSQKRTDMQRQVLDTFATHLAQHFGWQPEGGEARLRQWIAEASKIHEIGWRTLKDRLAEYWFSVFVHPLLSAKGAWTWIHWLRLNDLTGIGVSQKQRLSSYAIDTLVVYTLVNSSFWKQHHLNGWVCAKPYEVMVYQPQDHGRMTKMTTVYDATSADCEYRVRQESILEE